MDTRTVSSRGTGPGAIPITLEVNGAAVSLPVAPYVTLLDLLREQLQLTGTKKGCDHGHEAMEKTGMPAWLVDTLLELNALIRQGHAATLTSGVQQVLSRPPRSMREWAARLKTAPGTA